MDNTKKFDNEKQNSKDAQTSKGKRRKKRGYAKTTSETTGTPKRGAGNVITETGTNDVKWYQNVPGWENWASVPFSQKLGLPWRPNVTTGTFNIDNKNWIIKSNVGEYMGVAGVMELDFSPIYGYNDSPDDPINIAAQRIYAAVRRTQSGYAGYDKTDLMMLILAMDSLYMLYSDLCRAYKTIGKYNYESCYEPNTLCEAMGYKHDFLMQHYNDIAGFLKVMAYQIASINIPDVLDIISRHQWIASNVYTDSDSAQTQLYLFKPVTFYKWVEGEESPTHLSTITRKDLFGLPNDWTPVDQMDQISKAFNSLLTPLLGSQDVGVMSGDVIKAFGDGKMIQLSIPSEADTITPIFDVEVGNEIANAVVFSGGANMISDEVTQYLQDTKAGPYIQTSPIINNMSPRNIGCTLINSMLNLDGLQKGPAAVLTSTRLKAYPQLGADGKWRFDTCGTEVIVQGKVWTVGSQYGEITYSVFTSFPMLATSGALLSSYQRAFASDLQSLEVFKWCPMLVPTSINKADMDDEGEEVLGDTLTVLGLMCHAENYTRIPAETLYDINTYCLLSLFAPRM